MPRFDTPMDPVSATAIQERLRIFMAVAKRFMSLATLGDPDEELDGVRVPQGTLDLVQGELPLAACDLTRALSALVDICLPFLKHPDLRVIVAGTYWFRPIFSGILNRWGFETVNLRTVDDVLNQYWHLFGDPESMRARMPFRITSAESNALQRTLHLLEWAANMPRITPDTGFPMWLSWPTIDHTNGIVRWENQEWPVNDAGAALIQAYVNARGEWRTDAQLAESSELLKPRPDRVREKLPESLKALIEPGGNKGSRLSPERFWNDRVKFRP
jgi:hypothetical protein